MPQFIDFSTRKPKKSGRYFVKGRGSYMDVARYDAETEAFVFSEDVPANRVTDGYLQWLEEGDDTMSEYIITYNILTKDASLGGVGNVMVKWQGGITEEAIRFFERKIVEGNQLFKNVVIINIQKLPLVPAPRLRFLLCFNLVAPFA